MQTTSVSAVDAAHLPYHLPEPTQFLVRLTLLTR
jgi:hypothetical protein